jgi:hypothetical protein
MKPTRGPIRVWKSVFLTLSLLALAFKVGLPPGVMVGAGPGSIPLVICTGHGPLALTDPGSPKAPAPAPSQRGAPCPFAAASAGAPAPIPPPTLQPLVATYAPFIAPTVRDLAPGRGMAAPPPPSHAPPTLLI